MLMADQVIFHGSSEESIALLAALEHNCECSFDTSSGARTSTCSAHRVLEDQRALDGLVYARRIEVKLITEEFTEVRGNQ